MTSYCMRLLDDGKFRFLCPELSCEEEWPYVLVRHVAGLTPEEEQEYDEKIIENFNGHFGIKSCPGCETSCRRNDETNSCASCPVCTDQEQRFEFVGFVYDHGKRQHMRMTAVT